MVAQLTILQRMTRKNIQVTKTLYSEGQGIELEFQNWWQVVLIEALFPRATLVLFSHESPSLPFEKQI